MLVAALPIFQSSTNCKDDQPFTGYRTSATADLSHAIDLKPLQGEYLLTGRAWYSIHMHCACVKFREIVMVQMCRSQ